VRDGVLTDDERERRNEGEERVMLRADERRFRNELERRLLLERDAVDRERVGRVYDRDGRADRRDEERDRLALDERRREVGERPSASSSMMTSGTDRRRLRTMQGRSLRRPLRFLSDMLALNSVRGVVPG